MRITYLALFFYSHLGFATTYWAAPNGTHDVSGTSTFCQTISGTSPPSAYGTIGAAAACAKVAGDIVNIRGNMGAYSGNNHRIKTDNTSMTPTYALASGTSTAPTIIQGAPGDPRPLLNIPDWFTIYVRTSSTFARRDYITIRNLKIDAFGGSDNGGGAIQMSGGMNNTIDSVEITRWSGSAFAGFYDSGGTADCQSLRFLTIKNSYFHHAQSNGTGLNQYAIYYNGCDATIENNEFAYTIGGGIQVYYSGGKPKNAARAIIRGNYIHHVQMTNIERPGGGWQCWGMALDGESDQVTRNIVDLPNCDSRTTSGSGIAHGYSSPAGNVVITNNTIINTRGYPLEVGVFNSNAVNYKVQNNILFTPYTSSTLISYASAVVTKDHNACNNGSTLCGSFMVPLSNVDTCTVSTTDLHLKNGSPCIDKGVSVGEAFAGLAPDIGRYEFGSGTSASAPAQVKNLRVVQ
jgi:hypothetical protein